MSRSIVSDDELKKALEEKQAQKAVADEKQRWVARMLRSAKHHHKICPYFDKKTGMCFLTLGTKCERDGRFDNCPVFKAFLERKYDEYKSKGLPLPMDFIDITIGF